MKVFLPMLAVLALIAFPTKASAGISELTPAQQEQVKKGQQVMVTEEVPGNAWPRVKIYRLVNASPEEVVGVFCDYNNAKSFVPNLIKSEVSQKVSPTVMDVDYGLNVPILPDEYYTVRNTVKCTGEGNYRVDWKMLRAIQTKASQGSLVVEPYGDGKTFIIYQNLVTPGSAMAGLLRGKAIDQMKDTVQALGTEIERQKQSTPAELQKRVTDLQQALK